MQISLLFWILFLTAVTSVAAQDSKEEKDPYFAPISGGNWIFERVVGKPLDHNPRQFLGKIQHGVGGYTEGPILNCFAEGFSAYTTRITLEEFLNNPLFILFKKHKNVLNIKDKKIWVEQWTCGRTGVSAFPFIQTSYREGFYEFDGAIYILRFKSNRPNASPSD